MKFEVYLKRKDVVNDNQSARKKVAYVTARTVEEAKANVLARRENSAFVIDGTPRRVP